MWTQQDCVAFLVFLIFVFAPFFASSSTSESGIAWYLENREYVSCSPPAWLFGPVWFLLYGILTTCGFLLFGVHDAFYQDTPLYLAAYGLYIVNVVMTKYWYGLFFDARQIGMALWLAIAIALSALGVFVLAVLMEAWVPAFLYLPYVLWTTYAVYLTLGWWRFSGKTDPPVIDRKSRPKSNVDARRRPKKKKIIV